MIKLLTLTLIFFSSISNGMVCSEILLSSPEFWVEGRRVTILLNDLMRDRQHKYGGTHVMHVNQDIYEGMVGARFVSQMMEVDANIRVRNTETEGYIVSGVLESESLSVFIIKIDKMWLRREDTQGLEESESPRVINLEDRR